MKVNACFALLVLALSSAAGTDPSDNTTIKAPTGTSAVPTTNAPTGTSAVPTTNTPTGTSAVPTTNAPTGTSAVPTTNAPTGTSAVPTTKAPTGTSAVPTTNAPTGTSAVPTTNAPTGTSAVPTTNAPTGTSAVPTTNAPTGTFTVPTTNAPTGTSAVPTTNAPTGTSTVPTTNAPTGTSTVPTTNAPTGTSDVITTEAPVATTSTPAVSANTSVVISETNLLLGTDVFIELEVQGNTANTTDSESNILNGLTLVIFNGADGSVLQKYNTSTLTLNPTTGLAIQSVDKTDVQNLTSVAVVLYMSPQGVDTSKVENAQDFVSYATDNGTLVDKLAETILPHGAPLPVVGSHENETVALSMTRRWKETKDNSAFVLAPATRNQTNNATLSPKANATLQLRGNDCNDLVNDTDVRNTLVGKVNKFCQCGMSTLQIVGNGTCQKDYFFNFIINQSYEGQSEDFVASFQRYVNSSSTCLLNGKNYSVVNCTQQCWTSGHHLPPPTDSKSGNIKVTVAVVLSCIVVFLLILVAVIFYMRSKRRGIMRQFRMTRLQEDDDMDDMDNFMGAIDQEPDFSSSRNNLTN